MLYLLIRLHPHGVFEESFFVETETIEQARADFVANLFGRGSWIDVDLRDFMHRYNLDVVEYDVVWAQAYEDFSKEHAEKACPKPSSE